MSTFPTITVLAGKIGPRARHSLGAAACWFLIGTCSWTLVRAGSGEDDLSSLSLSELANTNVTSVARKPQRLAQAAAAIFVITRDDIRRSGAVSLPEVLRLAPGVQVARINQSEWAISARGFNGRWANKLLVLVDGRTVYSPLFSGVYWESMDLPLQDIERIEVIRGPGATMWGANAVNGVINILTRAAVDTQGSSVSVTVGDTDKVAASARYGGKIGSSGYFRVDSRYHDRSTESTMPWGNQWRNLRVGFRADWNASSRDSFMVSGEVYRGEVHSDYSAPPSQANPRPTAQDFDYTPQVENIVGRWERKLSDTTGLVLQVAYDRSRRSEVDQIENRDTLDADFQYRMLLGKRHDLVWGLDTRTSSDRLTGPLNIVFIPESLRNNLLSGFVQDEISLLPGTLQLVLGTKVERNTYMKKPEMEPGAQLIWTPNAFHTVWTSVARAVRAPARSDADLQLVVAPTPVGNGIFLNSVLLPNKNFVPETLIAYEIGYRFQKARASFDISSYWNRYDQLRSTEISGPVFTPVAGVLPPVLVLSPANQVYGAGRGFEVSTGYELTDSMRLLATYSFLDLSLKKRPQSNDQVYLLTESESPRHQGRLTWYWNLTRALSWDTSLYAVDRLSAPGIASYASVVSHVGWQIRKGLDAGITVDNLLDHRHREFTSTLEDQTGRATDSFGRTVRANIMWSF